VNIEDATTWSHDFKGDTLGEIKGAYGPYFIRLDVPGQKGIGIHGTHDNASIGTRASEGCIRMHNEDVTKLAQSIKPSTVVVIVPGLEDNKENNIDSSISLTRKLSLHNELSVKPKLIGKDSIKKHTAEKVLKVVAKKIKKTTTASVKEKKAKKISH
jgi:hypothetical protein